MPVETVFVRERSAVAISSQLFRRLEDSDQFRVLLEQGVVSLTRSRDVPFGLRAANFAGQALLEDDIRLVVGEKTPGALQALLHWSVPRHYRETELPMPVDPASPVLEPFARRFLAHVGSYLRHGRAKEYQYQVASTAVPRGRIDFKGTARLFARGRMRQVVHITPRLSADTLPNQLLALAIYAIDGLARSRGKRDDIADLARTYAPMFEDVDRSLMRRNVAVRAAAFARALSEFRLSDDLRKALAYGRAIVLNFGAWPEVWGDTKVPHSFFLNLETLFEEAVREVTSELWERGPVTTGVGLKRTLFVRVSDRYVADPDLVIRDGADVVLADCKYKDLVVAPDHADVYQLLAHCRAFRCRVGILVYPGERNSFAKLGEAADAVTVYCAKVRLSALRDDISAFLSASAAALAAPAA